MNSRRPSRTRAWWCWASAWIATNRLYLNFVKRFDVSYPTARDPQENLSYRYGTYKIPESYIIDRNGKVVRKYAGLPERDGQAISWMDPELVGFVKSLL